MRREGSTHREIAATLGISTGTADLWVKGISITPEQKRAIEERRNTHRFTPEERIVVLARLAKAREEQRYSSEELIEKIKEFHVIHGRIPLKRDFNSLRIYRQHFGSWNNAIRVAGFEPNPVLFSKRHVARDGHVCDSFTEKVIDDWLFENGFVHERNVPYGATKFTADFQLFDRHVIEFFGLARVQKAYDEIIITKRRLARNLGWNLIEIYPEDMFPNKLPLILGTNRDFSWRRRIRT